MKRRAQHRAMSGPLPEGHPLLNALRRNGIATDAAIDGDFILLVKPAEKMVVRARLCEATLRMLKTGEWLPGPIELLAPQGEDTLAWAER
jgi:hypothetical protein